MSVLGLHQAIEISSSSVKVFFDMQVLLMLGLHQGLKDQQGLDVGALTAPGPAGSAGT